MSYGAYFATQPSTRTYIDTSQPLNGFGAAEGGSDLLAIYDGVAGLGAAPAGCGCAGTRGRLSGFGDEVLPDGTSTGTLVPSAFATNLKTGLVALLAVSSVAVMAYFFLGGSKMRANGRRVGTRSMPTRRKNAFYVSTYCNKAHSLKTGRPLRHECRVLPPAALRAERDGDYDRANAILSGKMRRNGSFRKPLKRHRRTLKRFHPHHSAADKGGHVFSWKNDGAFAYLQDKRGRKIATIFDAGSGWTVEMADGMNGVEVARHVRTKTAAKKKAEGLLRGAKWSGSPLRPNGAPAYLLQKKGKTTKRQAKAAGHYLAETRWHGGPKRTARWSGKHLAHRRFNTNGIRGSWQPHDNGYALVSGGKHLGYIDKNNAQGFKPYFLGKHGHMRKIATVSTLAEAKRQILARLGAG